MQQAEGGSAVDFISKMAAGKMGQLRLELVELNERLAEATNEEQIRKLRKTIQEKEVYYNILADRLRTHTRNFEEVPQAPPLSANQKGTAQAIPFFISLYGKQNVLWYNSLVIKMDREVGSGKFRRH